MTWLWLIPHFAFGLLVANLQLRETLLRFPSLHPGARLHKIDWSLAVLMTIGGIASCGALLAILTTGVHTRSELRISLREHRRRYLIQEGLAKLNGNVLQWSYKHERWVEVRPGEWVF